MTKPAVLVVEDDVDLRALMERRLEAEGYTCAVAVDGTMALEKARTLGPGLVLLDVRLPGMDGLETLREMRRWSDVPVIVCTAWPNDADMVEFFRLGIEQYVTKPVSMPVLLARVEAVLRKNGRRDVEPTSVLRFEGLEIDTENARVTLDGAAVPLSSIEFDVLCCLAQKPDRLLSVSAILEKVWGAGTFEEHYVHKAVSAIRKKLRETRENPRFIRSVYGKGYCFIGKKSR